jgi:hypothetical protein
VKVIKREEVAKREEIGLEKSDARLSVLSG